MRDDEAASGANSSILITWAIREALTELLEIEPEKNSRPVAKLLRLLEQLERREIERLYALLPTPPIAPRQYRVEPTGHSETLVEFRVGTTGQPFRCPYHVYRSAAKVIPGLPNVFSFEMFHTAVNKNFKTPIVGVIPRPHQLRPCLRLWCDRKLLSTQDRDYLKASGSRDFVAEAEKLWQELRVPQHE